MRFVEETEKRVAAIAGGIGLRPGLPVLLFAAGLLWVAGSASRGVAEEAEPPSAPGAAAGEADVSGEGEGDGESERASFRRPKYAGVRYREDWSDLAGRDRGQTGDLFDVVKYMPVTEDGEVWFGLGGQARARLEGWTGFLFGFPAGDTDDVFLLTRFRYHADLHATKYIRGFVEGKSAFSTDRSLAGGRRTLDVDELDLQNGFLDLNAPLGEAASLTVRSGRQELLFGSQRLVSPLDWSNTRRTWDGFSGILTAGDWDVTGFWTQFAPVRKYEFNRSDAGVEFYGLFAEGMLPTTTLGLDLYFLGLMRDQASFNGTAGKEDRFTLGGRVDGVVADTPLDFDLEGAYQFGDVGDGSIDAFMVAGDLGYRLATDGVKPRLYAGSGYASGDESPGGDVQTFNQLFPLGHAYLGYIDVIGRQNIIDVHAGASVEPYLKLVVALTGHYFWRAETADALYNAGGGVVPRPSPADSSQDVGAEIDLTAKYAFDRHLVALFGYSHFFPGKYIRQTGPSKHTNFLYLQLQYTF